MRINACPVHVFMPIPPSPVPRFAFGCPLDPFVPALVSSCSNHLPHSLPISSLWTSVWLWLWLLCC